MENLNLLKREKNCCHSAKKSRKNGMVPGVIYKKGMENCLFEIGELELNSIISNNGEFSLLNVNLNGENKKALIKEIQRDPVNRKIMHLDLEETNAKDKIISNVPIKFIGENILNKYGSIVQKEKESVKIECYPEKLPKNLKVNLKDASIGSVYKISDLEVGNEISIIDDIDSVIASISYEQKIVEAID